MRETKDIRRQAVAPGAQARAGSRRAVDAARRIEATLADLAHEIRTPLTGILALSELLATSELAERERGWAKAIKSTAEHLALLTSLIVDAARAEARGLVLRRELVRPRRLAEALAASLAARAEAKGLEHAADISGDLPEAVIGDPLRLRAALENLIDNAVKFTERGSVRLAVAAANGRARQGAARLHRDRQRHRAHRCRDPAAVSAVRAGERAGRAPLRRRRAGPGLGQAHRQGHGRRSDGRERARAAAAGSARASPWTRSRRQRTRRRRKARPPARRRLRALSILCAEDNPYGRVVLNTILTELGHRADFVGTGAAAVEAVAQGRYDVVLMDVTLPDLDGIEATRRIRALEARPAACRSSACPAAPMRPTRRPAAPPAWTAISPSRSARAR